MRGDGRAAQSCGGNPFAACTCDGKRMAVFMYVLVSNRYTVYLELPQCCMSVIFQKCCLRSLQELSSIESNTRVKVAEACFSEGGRPGGSRVDRPVGGITSCFRFSSSRQEPTEHSGASLAAQGDDYKVGGVYSFSSFRFVCQVC